MAYNSVFGHFLIHALFCTFRVDDVEGLELLRWEDQQKIRKYIDGAVVSNSSASANVECGIEVSQTSRATCRSCNQKIAKGEVGYLRLNLIK